VQEMWFRTISGKHALRVGTQSPQSQTGRVTAAGTYTNLLLKLL
jgi:hypothetical protein